MSNIEINEDACENTSVKQKKDDKTLLTAGERARSKGNKKKKNKLKAQKKEREKTKRNQ